MGSALVQLDTGAVQMGLWLVRIWAQFSRTQAGFGQVQLYSSVGLGLGSAGFRDGSIRLRYSSVEPWLCSVGFHTISGMVK